MKRVAIIGTQGVPAKYGGFETLVENIIGVNAAPDVEYTVFCSARDYDEHRREHKGARLRYVPWLHANGAQSIAHDMLSMLMCLGRGYTTVVVLGVSGCMFMPVFRLLYRGRIVVNIDGLEHRRAKWGGLARWLLRQSEAMAVRFADTVVADNAGIQQYVTETYGRPSTLIAYGGDHVERQVSPEREAEVLARYGLTPGGYAFCVCRIEPENNCHVTLEACARARQRLVAVGNWRHSAYGERLREEYGGREGLTLLDAVYDLDTLYVLRRNAAIYIHGHSAGGTNPSLVEAMFFGRPIACWDVVYNRATTDGRALYFHDAESLADILRQPLPDGSRLLALARQRYRWATIARQYEALY